MPTYPTTGLNFGNFLTHTNAQTDGEGLIHSQSLSGGYQEVNSIAERNLIPVKADKPGEVYTGFTASGTGGWSSGRRRIGMLVYCLDVDKLYILKPVGYFGNGGNGDEAAWLALPQPERAVRIFPNGSFTSGLSAPPPPITSTYTDAASLSIDTNAEGVALTAEELKASCWVELAMGIDGNPITDLSYSSGDLTITLTHDGNGSGTPISFTETIPIGYDGIYDPVVDDTTVMPSDVGGIDANTTAGDLAGLSMNQMWDKLLFPTVNPTGSGAFANLTESYNLLEAQSLINMNLTPTAGRGTLTNPSGNWAGNINDAYITDISSGGATISQQNLTTSPPSTINALTYQNYPVVLGENKFKLWVSFDQGPMPKDSTGADYPGVRYNLANNPKTNTTEFEGVFPIYLGKADGTFEKRGLVSQGANNITCQQNYGENSGTGLWHRIAVPQAMVTGGDITIQYDAGQLGYQASYPGSAWVKTSTTFDVHANALAVPYFLYTKGFPQGGQATWIVNW